MKILIIDTHGCGALDWALRCKGAGHDVRWYVQKTKTGEYNQVGTGLIERVSHWEPHMKWADLIFLVDNIKYIHNLESYRKKGFPIFGPSVVTSDWELDRKLGQDVFRKAGIKVMPSNEFHKYEDAISFVEKNLGRWVSKPLGDADKALSYCAKSPADMIYMLERWKRKDKLKNGFILQEFMPGIEMAVGGWFGYNGFSKWWCENWEFKKLMNDDKGVATGEQGTVLRYTKESLLADKVLKPLEDFLSGLGYTGYVDVNCIIDKSGTPWPLEFTTRPGWPLFNIQQAVHPEPCEWMVDILDGVDSFKPSDKIAVGVVLSQPDYPYSRLTKREVTGVPVYGVEESTYINNIHLAEIMLGKAPYLENGKIKRGEHLVTSGDYILITSGTGYTVKKAKERAYAVVDSIEIPNSIGYRTDIGHRLEKQLPELQKLGYCPDMEYE